MIGEGAGIRSRYTQVGAAHALVGCFGAGHIRVARALAVHLRHQRPGVGLGHGHAGELAAGIEGLAEGHVVIAVAHDAEEERLAQVVGHDVVHADFHADLAQGLGGDAVDHAADGALGHLRGAERPGGPGPDEPRALHLQRPGAGTGALVGGGLAPNHQEGLGHLMPSVLYREHDRALAHGRRLRQGWQPGLGRRGHALGQPGTGAAGEGGGCRAGGGRVRTGGHCGFRRVGGRHRALGRRGAAGGTGRGHCPDGDGCQHQQECRHASESPALPSRCHGRVHCLSHCSLLCSAQSGHHGHELISSVSNSTLMDRAVTPSARSSSTTPSSHGPAAPGLFSPVCQRQGRHRAPPRALRR